MIQNGGKWYTALCFYKGKPGVGLYAWIYVRMYVREIKRERMWVQRQIWHPNRNDSKNIKRGKELWSEPVTSAPVLGVGGSHASAQTFNSAQTSGQRWLKLYWLKFVRIVHSVWEHLGATLTKFYNYGAFCENLLGMPKAWRHPINA